MRLSEAFWSAALIRGAPDIPPQQLSPSMYRLGRIAVALVAAGMVLGGGLANLAAQDSAAPVASAAISSGDFGSYATALSQWLDHQVPADAKQIQSSSIGPLLKNPQFFHALSQRQLLTKLGPAQVAAFAAADPDNKAFLTWLLGNSTAMDLYLDAATPTGLRARDANQWTLPISTLERWKNIYFADPESRDGLYLKLAIATALAPPGSGSPGAGQAKTPVAPLDRYLHFKTAQRNHELFPSFDHLTAWEMTKVVQSGASNEDLAWGRQMINTWRPDLRENEMVVNSTSEVWRRNSPIPFDNTYKNVLTGGGKCGPRSSWSVFICQAFGVPAMGVGQPGHACVAWKAANPMVEPQPGSAWKVGYGRGWPFSRLDGLSGPEFLEGVGARAQGEQFSLVEHLRWLASAVTPAERSAAIKTLLGEAAAPVRRTKTDLTASLKPEEAEADHGVNPSVRPATKAGEESAAPPQTQEPAKPVSGVLALDAAGFSKMGGEASYPGLQVAGVRLHHSYPNGKQVYFQSNMKSAWVSYLIDVPANGEYILTLTTAAVNLDQKLDVFRGDEKLASVDVPMSHGLWTLTKGTEIKLEKGVQELKISAGFQRGVAIKSLELKAAVP